MLRKALSLALAAASGALLLAAGCGKPAPGGSCDEKQSQPVCTDAQTLLTCDAGQWQPSSCLGPKGCSASGARAECDTTRARDGDGCRRDGDYSCAVDGKSQLRCKGGKW